MYATLSYDVTSGAEPIDDVRQAILEVFADRETCDLLADTFICEVDTTEDYLDLFKKLRRVGNDFEDQFLFVFTLHRSGSPLKSNASFPKAKANAIIDPGDDE